MMLSPAHPVPTVSNAMQLLGHDMQPLQLTLPLLLLELMLRSCPGPCRLRRLLTQWRAPAVCSVVIWETESIWGLCSAVARRDGGGEGADARG